MSRLDDLIDLIQTANEMYLINPARNTRSAFILVDDLCELVMKSYLQMNDTSWSPVSHQNKGRDYFKGFRIIIEEVRKKNGGNATLHGILDRVQERRENRNHFFHDQDQAGLTVDDRNCLLGFTDLYELTGSLFGHTFAERLQANPVVLAQMGSLKLRLRGYRTRAAYDSYFRALHARGALQIEVNGLGYEFCVIYEDATRFVERMQQHFENEVIVREAEIARISSLKRISSVNLIKLGNLQSEVNMYKEIVRDCLS